MKRAVLVLLLVNLSARGAPIGVSPTNKHYFHYGAQDVVLIGASTSYMWVTNSTDSYTSILDTMAASGLNKIRLLLGDFPIAANITDYKNAHSGSNPPKATVDGWLTPWARDGTSGGFLGDGTIKKFDLATWDNSYFTRLTNILDYCVTKGIFVELCFFCQWYSDTYWSFSPLNARNNIQGQVTLSARNDYFKATNSTLLNYQDAYVKKVVDTVNSYDNIYFEVENEPDEFSNSNVISWHDRIINTIRTRESGLSKTHLVAISAPEIWNSGNLTHKMDVLNSHYVTSAKSGWIAARPILDNNYGTNVPLCFDETDIVTATQTADDARIESWMFIAGGGGCYDNLNWQISATLYNYLNALKTRIMSLNFSLMAPIPQNTSVITSGIRGGLAFRGIYLANTQYLIYLYRATLSRSGTSFSTIDRSSHSESLTISMANGPYTVRWFNPADNTTISTTVISANGSSLSVTSPKYTTGDIGLQIDAGTR